MALYMEIVYIQHIVWNESGNRNRSKKQNRKKPKQTTRIIKIDIEMLKPQKKRVKRDY